MLTQRELESQLRVVHPYREEAARQRQSLASARKVARVAFGVSLGLAFAVGLLIVQMFSTGGPLVARERTTAWGRSHVSQHDAGEAHVTRSTFARKERRPYNPLYDPRARAAQRSMQAVLR